MKKLLILVTVVVAAGCSEEIPLPPSTTSEAPPAEFREETLKAEQEAQRQIALMAVNEAVQGYRMLHKEKLYPRSLNQLVEDGMLGSLPELPEGYRFTYDPSNGKVDIEVGIDSSTPSSETEAESGVEDSQGSAERAGA